jgi:ATP-dependent protease ClpP protease subunit
MNKGLVKVHGRLTKDLLLTIKKELESLVGHEFPIILDIDSNGGLAAATQDTIEVLRTIRRDQPQREIIACIRNAKSAAVMFAAMATRRLILPTGEIFLHLGARLIEVVDIDPQTMQMRPEVGIEMTAQKTRYLEVLAKHMPVPNPYFARLISTGKLKLSAAECAELGYATVVEQFPTN